MPRVFERALMLMKIEGGNEESRPTQELYARLFEITKIITIPQKWQQEKWLAYTLSFDYGSTNVMECGRKNNVFFHVLSCKLRLFPFLLQILLLKRLKKWQMKEETHSDTSLSKRLCCSSVPRSSPFATWSLLSLRLCFGGEKK